MKRNTPFPFPRAALAKKLGGFQQWPALVDRLESSTLGILMSAVDDLTTDLTTRTSLDRIPCELLTLILQFALDGLTDFRRLALVNKGWLALCKTPSSISLLKRPFCISVLSSESQDAVICVSERQEAHIRLLHKYFAGLASLELTADRLEAEESGSGADSHLVSVPLSTSALSCLAFTSFINLSSLVVRGAMVLGDAALGCLLRALPRGLLQLDLTRCALGPCTWAALLKLSRGRLLRLTLDGTGVCSARIEELVLAQPHLEELSLNNCKLLTDESCSHLAILQNLYRLDLWGCFAIGPVGVAALCGLRALMGLYLGGCYRVTDTPFAQMASMPCLEVLNVAAVDMSDAALGCLARAPRLRKLNLALCSGITDVGVHLLSALTQLQMLDLSDCEGVTDEAMHCLPRGLRPLRLGGCVICDAGAVAVAWRGLVSLRVLSLRGCEELTMGGLQALSKGLPSLQTLDLHGCAGLHGEGRKGTLAACVAGGAWRGCLQELDVCGVPGVRGIGDLLQVLPMPRLTRVALSAPADGHFPCWSGEAEAAKVLAPHICFSFCSALDLAYHTYKP